MAADLKELKEIEETGEDISSRDEEIVNIKKIKKEAKKEKKRLEKEAKKKKGKSKFSIILIFVAVLLIVAGVLIIGFNVFNIRDQYLNDTLRNIPVIQNLLPKESITDEDPLSDVTKEELIEQIDLLQKEIEALQSDLEQASLKAGMDATTIKNLKEIEMQQIETKNLKEELDTLIASGDPTEFARFYEQISPENAEKLYKETISINQVTKEIKNYVSAYSEMDPIEASNIFEELMSTDSQLVVSILKNMPADARAEIIANMNPVSGASITKLMSPEQFIQ